MTETLTDSDGDPQANHQDASAALELRVRFGETDQMRIAHHGSYVLWLEAGRVEWLRQRAMSYRAMEDEGLSLAVAGLEVRYRTAALFDDLVQVHTRLVQLRSRMLRFEYRLIRADDGALLATAATIHVPTDRAGGAVRLPQHWLEPLARYVEES